MIASDALAGSMESNVQVNVGVLVALIQTTLGMRKVKMLTFCKIHVNDLLYFMEKESR